ncbi:MAG: O-antigen ligase family protein [Alphaproteobacteria bacterium]|nr:O-antigen ligase family protein [Alphaproteobacteria bacterium]MBU3975217.1 O-antigen ligase family protein [Alphaproteobacteria bacterium]MBU4039611.1 O-antigen ligase family protein [Alphaproteobacteria bacterium]MBU4135136.1 O-antigen ligase family protein [Alphaproteobacteria bacterium]
MKVKSLKGQWDAVAIAAATLLALSFVFGGASQGHALRLALVELAALPLLVLAASRLIQTGSWRQHRFALGLLAMLVAIPLLQLLPLPPAVWTALPGRDQAVLALQLAGLEPGWASLSLSPDRTWGSALALTPPAAFFLAMLSLSQAQRERLIQFCFAAAIVGILLGAAQLASGSDRLYVWSWTGAGSVNGFFANRNHLASSLLVTLPFAVIFGAATLRRRDRRTSALWFGALFAGLVVVALAAIRSRAGITLFAPVMMFSLLAAWIAAGRGRPGPALLVLVGAVGAALTAVAVLALPPILARFDTEGAPEARFERWPLVAETAQTYLPLGSGLGSFDAVYRSVEPLEELDSTFFNQAHNDYLETWLETGWLGIGLILVFLVWFARRSWTAWKAPPSREGDLQRAASIGIGVLLLHSVGDYPLRTVTLAVLFALCCGLLELAGRPAPAR